MAAVEQNAHASTALTRARNIRRQIAAKDPQTFARLVLRDERTGKEVEQAPLHDKWLDVLRNENRTVIWAHVEAGKSQQLSIGRTLMRLGQDPNRRIVLVSNTGEQAKKIVRTLGQYIEKSDELHHIFPDLKKAKDISLPWTSTMLTVQRSAMGKDPSIQACGMHGNVTGSRIDDLILDDILDYENTRTDAARKDAWQWIQSTLLPRISTDGSVLCVGNAWHPEDAMHKMAELPAFRSYRFPVRSPTGELSWPARWPNERIDKAIIELGPLEANRQLFCLARDDAAARFKREWIDCSLAKGVGYRTVDAVPMLPEGGYAIYTGVDLAVQRNDAADKTVFFTILLHPDGTRQVLHIRSGKWSGPEIVDNLVDMDRRFGGVFVIENVAAQDFLLQFAPALGSRATIIPFTTGRNKANPDFGVESLAAEVAGGRWIIPCTSTGKMDAEVAAWVGEMLYYTPTAHTGDRLMASWFAREGARAFERRGGGSGGAGRGQVGSRTIG